VDGGEGGLERPENDHPVSVLEGEIFTAAMNTDYI
jgi:hypothetical protein